MKKKKTWNSHAKARKVNASINLSTYVSLGVALSADGVSF